MKTQQLHALCTICYIAFICYGSQGHAQLSVSLLSGIEADRSTGVIVQRDLGDTDLSMWDHYDSRRRFTKLSVALAAHIPLDKNLGLRLGTGFTNRLQPDELIYQKEGDVGFTITPEGLRLRSGSDTVDYVPSNYNVLTYELSPTYTMFIGDRSWIRIEAGIRGDYILNDDNRFLDEDNLVTDFIGPSTIERVVLRRNLLSYFGAISYEHRFQNGLIAGVRGYYMRSTTSIYEGDYDLFLDEPFKIKLNRIGFNASVGYEFGQGSN